MARRWLFLVLLATLAGAAGPTPSHVTPSHVTPSRVTYVLGGIVSGPYRLSADLNAGTVEESRAPSGRLGDGAGLDPWTMPATTRRRLRADDMARIASLAGLVWQDGIHSDAKCPITAAPSLDALVSFAMAAPGGTHRFDTAAQCMTAAADQLQRALYGAAHP